MYLNILEYIEFEKQDNLIEMIDMATRTEGVFAKMKRQERTRGRTEGRTEGERNIILELLKTNTPTEVSHMINKDVGEIEKIIGIE